jgi:hypothetical protein
MTLTHCQRSLSTTPPSYRLHFAESVIIPGHEISYGFLQRSPPGRQPVRSKPFHARSNSPRSNSVKLLHAAEIPGRSPCCGILRDEIQGIEVRPLCSLQGRSCIIRSQGLVFLHKTPDSIGINRVGLMFATCGRTQADPRFFIREIPIQA